MKKLSLCALSLGLLAVAGAAQAQTLASVGSASFGGQGQVSITGDFNISFAHVSGQSALVLQPAAVYFIAPQLAIGGAVLFSYAGSDAFSETHLGIGPRVGYNIPIADLISFFPQAGFGIDHGTTSSDTPVGSVSRSDTYFSLMIYAPFLFHPAQHFFIGLGPSVDAIVAGGNSSARDTTIGLRTTVGGWFDW